MLRSFLERPIDNARRYIPPSLPQRAARPTRMADLNATSELSMLFGIGVNVGDMVHDGDLPYGARQLKHRSPYAPERQKTQKAVPTNAELHSAKQRVLQRSSFVWPRMTSLGRHRIWLRRAPAHLVPEPGSGSASQLRRQVQMDRRFRCPCPSRRCERRVPL